jgi:hypothetical protein
MKQRKTIAVDIDDVLSKSAECFVAFSSQRWGMSLKPEDYQEEWAVLWGVPLDGALERSIEFHSLGVVGDYQPHEALKHTKAELCREIGAEYLIDDQIKHCAGAARAGLKAVLFGRSPGAALPAGVTRAAHWDEVAEYFHV